MIDCVSKIEQENKKRETGKTNALETNYLQFFFPIKPSFQNLCHLPLYLFTMEAAKDNICTLGSDAVIIQNVEKYTPKGCEQKIKQKNKNKNC